MLRNANWGKTGLMEKNDMKDQYKTVHPLILHTYMYWGKTTMNQHWGNHAEECKW